MIADDKIQEALYHWTPRFLASGIDYNDFQRIRESMERWDDWCRAWSARGREHEAWGNEALAAGHAFSAGEAFRRAALYFHFGQMIFYTDLDQKLAAHDRQVALYRRAAPLLRPAAERLEIPYEDTTLPAYLRLPPGAGPHPLVILVCGTDSVKEQEGHWEEALLARDLATLAFDGPGQGEMWSRMKMRLDYETAISALVDYLVTRPEIDPTRIGMLGHSLGGYLAARAAAFEHRIAAAVLLAGFFRRGTWEEMRRFSRAGLKHLFGLSSDAEAKEIAQQMTLEGVADKIRCPLLVIHGTRDTIVPPENAHALAAATTCPTELLIFPEGNHSCNNIVYKVHAAAGDWLADQLGRDV